MYPTSTPRDRNIPWGLLLNGPQYICPPPALYEAILRRLEPVAASLGVGRASQRVRQGVNPWRYSNGKTEGGNEQKEMELLEKEAKSETSSLRSSITLAGKSEAGRLLAG